MIAEAAYYLAQKRGFHGEHSLEDWLAAEQQVRQVISPILDSEVPMTDTIRQNQPKPNPKSTARQGPPSQSKQDQPKLQGASRFEKFAATQAAGDGVQGDAKKPLKTIDEKLGANMADRK